MDNHHATDDISGIGLQIRLNWSSWPVVQDASLRLLAFGVELPTIAASECVFLPIISCLKVSRDSRVVTSHGMWIFDEWSIAVHIMSPLYDWRSLWRRHFPISRSTAQGSYGHFLVVWCALWRPTIWRHLTVSRGHLTASILALTVWTPPAPIAF